MLKTKNLWMLLLSLALLAAGGCIFSPDPEPPCTNCGGTEEIVFPDTADKLMANFKVVYENMDFPEFAKMLDPNYVTILQESTYNQFPDVGQTLDLEEELYIHNRMFSGQDQTDPDGNLVAGIQSISFQTFEKKTAWAESPPNDQIPNADFALFDVVFEFNRGQDHNILKVTGEIKFYVTHRDSVVGELTRPYYQMRGQVDLTDDTPN